LRDRQLRSFTARTPATREALEARLASIRAQGYAVCDQELEEGLRSIAVPIANRRGTTLAAINVSSRAARTSVDHMLRVFLPRLKEVATESTRRSTAFEQGDSALLRTLRVPPPSLGVFR
jgi:IclR family pca regulon transcriptional regulator